MPNDKQIHSGSEKRRSALLIAVGDLRRYAKKTKEAKYICRQRTRKRAGDARRS